jgi:hypothetical protein
LSWGTTNVQRKGDEAILGVLGRVDEWIQEDWPRYLSLSLNTRVASNSTASCTTKAQSQKLTITHGPNAVLLQCGLQGDPDTRLDSMDES